MSEESMHKPKKYPHTVESTNSSVDDNDQSFTGTANGSLILNNNGNDKFLAQTLRSYIDALKFDPTAQEETFAKKDSSVVEEFLGRDQNSSGKRATSGNGYDKSKSRVKFSSNKSSSGNLDQNFANSSLKSQPQLSSKEGGKRGKTKSSTNTVIREWGKRPLLVESEAPWTPRNRMYQNALKAVARGKQLNQGGNSNNMPQAPMFFQHPVNMSYPYPVNNGNPNFFVPPTNYSSVLTPYGPVSPVGQQPPVLTGISPIPVDMNGRPLSVAIEPSSTLNPYAYHHAGMVQSVQQPQSVVYGQFNSQGAWVPFLGPPEVHQQQQGHPEPR